MPRRLLAVFGFIVAVSVFAGGVWWFAYTSGLQQVADRGRADLSSAAERLVGQLERFRQVAVLMADHPILVALAQGEGVRDDASALLLQTADQSGSLEISFLSRSGWVLASSDSTAIGLNLSTTAEFERAMQGALGVEHAQVGNGQRRAFAFAAPVFDAGFPAGAVVVRVDMETVEESDWRGDPQAIFFTDDQGVIFVANRSELLFRTRGLMPEIRYEPEALQPFIQYQERSISGLSVWSLDAGRYLPKRALHLVQPLPVIGMTGEALVDTAPAERIATLQAAVAGALCLAFGAFLFWATERRRTLALANAELETRVAERTEELVSVNQSLRHEIAEREEAEAALKKAQADLVQAGKLSALGQMSAGISHELNQPLMAIRSFSENAEVFLEREKPDVARQNLSRISELARRMGRIIKNLRAFARQENEPISDVDICAVVQAVLELSEARIAQGNVKLDWEAPDHPVFVRGGDVRLQQVVMNLVTNAMDAMSVTSEKRLELFLEQEDGKVLLHVRDTGPGIDDPEKIFDPFYSTKEVGQSEGMGLGLSISYGLVQSFGGAIRGRNHPERGAIFTVELTSAMLEEAA